MRRLLGLAMVVLAVLVALIFFFKKVHYVDTKSAAALGAQYFSYLKGGQVERAFAMYGQDVRAEHNNWLGFLVGFSEQYGPVTEFTLADAKVLPVQELVCVVVTYHVTRKVLFTEERLTVCPAKSASPMAINGHAILRLDTGQEITAGIVGRGKEIVSNGRSDILLPAVIRLAADRFYTRLSGEQYEAIYDASGDDFRKLANRDSVVRFLQAVNKRTGGHCSANPLLVNVTNWTIANENMWSLTYERNCENENISDTTAWKLINNKPVPAGVQVKNETDPPTFCSGL